MGCSIGDVVWLRRDSRLVELRGRVGTNVGRVGDAWADDDGEHISVVYEDEQVLAVDVPPAEFTIGRAAASMVVALRNAACPGTIASPL
ncbi:hypothetical protein D3273_18910 [Lichenibacterium minor]|uniref:Uncharacterized protein n=1 Tax=Lichenibacterium minor TaxID=2316528 RepID=A0A4Q2U6G4_9HYPH|nr:hypothetical protein [Lichenibacterium minor]RYC30466.1 hypothetical protein D3273_18910 [Lichenibacterium minor]